MTERRGDDVTLGEVVRRLDDVARQLGDLLKTLDSSYVRKDVYNAERAADRTVAKELRVDFEAMVSQQQANRRLALSGIAFPILTIVIGLVLGQLFR